MVQNYKKKTERGQYEKESLQKALDDLYAGATVKETGQKYGIPCKTLHWHHDGNVKRLGEVNIGRHQQVLSPEIEMEIFQHMKNMEKASYGLSTSDVQKLAFDVAEKCGAYHPFSKEKGAAGETWLQGFLKRNPSLSLRSPTATSMARDVGFNEIKVAEVFGAYKSVNEGIQMSSNQVTANDIWNMDESGLTIVQTPTKILAAKGKHQIGKVVSAERAQPVNVICRMNAGGNYMYSLPVFIFPRKRMAETLLNGAPPCSLGYVSDSGGTDGTICIALQHLSDCTGASKEHPKIIVLDGHSASVNNHRAVNTASGRLYGS